MGHALLNLGKGNFENVKAASLLVIGDLGLHLDWGIYEIYEKLPYQMPLQYSLTNFDFMNRSFNHI